jgi:dipeptidyl aminopeptidase/acylaminoacyl peptidase
MFGRYGPWSTALGDEGSLHLSAFWRRRMSQLDATRSARHILTRRDCLQMGLAAASALAIPTLHLAMADGPGTVKAPDVGTIYVRANFDTDDNGRDQALQGIFAVDPKTLARNWIADDFAFRCRLSPDGRLLALSRSGWTANHEINDPGTWTIDAQGKGEKRKIADFGGVVSWSPDGKQIIVSRGLSKPSDDESRHVSFRMNADGTGAAELPIPATEEVDDWSRDGRWIVTVSDRHPPQGSGYQLYIMHPDGSEQRRLTEDMGLNVYPRFSPDGRQIAYLHQEHGKDSLWVVGIDGKGRRLLIEGRPDQSLGSLEWSPDGKSLVYEDENWELDEKGEAHSINDFRKADRRLQMIDIDGTNQRRLELPQARWLELLDWR